MIDPHALAQDAAALDGPGANRPVIRTSTIGSCVTSRNWLLVAVAIGMALAIGLYVVTAECAGCPL